MMQNLYEGVKFEICNHCWQQIYFNLISFDGSRWLFNSLFLYGEKKMKNKIRNAREKIRILAEFVIFNKQNCQFSPDWTLLICVIMVTIHFQSISLFLCSCIFLYLLVNYSFRNPQTKHTRAWGRWSKQHFINLQ